MADKPAQRPLWPDEAAAQRAPTSSAGAGAGDTRRNWIAVACAEHAGRGAAPGPAGFMQVCHGKAAPLKRVQPGDRVSYYAPTETMGGRERVQAFVSIGLVQPGPAYAVDMGGGFVPWRKNVCFLPARRAPIAPLLGQLEFTRDRTHWGSQLRFGLLAISAHDMRLIACALAVDPELLFF